MVLKIFLRRQREQALLAVIKLVRCGHLRVFFVQYLLFNMIFDSLKLAEPGITILCRTLEIQRRSLTRRSWIKHRILHATRPPCQVLGNIRSLNLNVCCDVLFLYLWF